MSTFPQQRSKLAKSLLNELTFLLKNLDDKKSNFFISTLISSVLMYHLAWVPTVAPIANFEERNGKNLFYDPLWAQLGDLYGSIGTPSIMSRTIIVGSDMNTVRRILFVLSYFIRCNEVYERTEHMIPIESQFEERKKALAKCENNLQDNIRSKVSSEYASETLSSSLVEIADNLNRKVDEDESKNTADIHKIQSNGVNSSKQAADNRPKSVNLNLSFVDDFTENLLEVPMPKSQDPIVIKPSGQTHEDNGPFSNKLPYRADELFVKSYGRSLMVGYCDTYMSDFVLMGLPKLDDFQESLDVDLKNSLLMQPLSSQDTISKSVCILGDLDRLNCSALGYRTVAADEEDHIFVPLNMSDHICAMLHRCKDLYTNMGIPAESCLEYIEDNLRILYYKAVMYRKLFSSSLSASTPSIYIPLSSDDNVPLNMLDAIGLQESDIPLVKAVNSTF